MGFRLARIKRVDVFKQALAAVESYIEDNQLSPGERLPSDRVFAEELGVSRVVVRQALKVLESVGRLEIRQGSGTYVSDAAESPLIHQALRGVEFDEPFFSDLVRLRTEVEVLIFSEVFEQLTDEKLQKIRRALDKQKSSIYTDIEGADFSFALEAALGEVCTSKFLRRMQKLIHQIWLQSFAAVGKGPADKALFELEHDQIFQCMQMGDYERGVRLLRAHLSAERLIRSLRDGKSVHQCRPSMRIGMQTGGSGND